MYFDIGLNYIAKIIHNLDRNKAHGHHISSIHLPKACSVHKLYLQTTNSIYKPLQLIFQSCIENGKSPSEWKFQIHKKGNK